MRTIVSATTNGHNRPIAETSEWRLSGSVVTCNDVLVRANTGHARMFSKAAGDIGRSVVFMKNCTCVYQIGSSPMRVIVLPVGTTVTVTADMQIHNEKTDKHGKPDKDLITASTVVRIER
jgi:hypothetical protein